MDEFLEQFLIESRELVAQATEELLALEQEPGDRGPLDAAFRAFHTLKGAAGIVEFAAMGRVMHEAEELLASARAGARPVTESLVGGCLAALDQVTGWLDILEATGKLPGDAPAETPVPEDRSWVDRLLAEHPGIKGARTAIRYEPDETCFFRGDDPLALIAGLPGLLGLDLRPRRPWPPLEEMDPFACNLIIEALSAAPAEAAAAHLGAARDRAAIYALPEHNTAPPPLPEAAAAMLKAQLDLLAEPGEGGAGRLAAAGRAAANVLRHLGREAEAAEIGLAASEPAALRAAIREVLNEPDRAEQAEPVPAAARALRVEVERIDALVKLAGEMTVAKNALGHAARLARDGADPAALAEALARQHAALDRLTAELRRSALAIRLLPLRHVFQRFPRLVREMAASLGKPARLVTEGEATEVDKAVAEALFEPLLHVLRNAMDHGVEPPAERAALGKPATATIRLGGWREGEHVIVEAGDDGRGIDPDRVRRTALERNPSSAGAIASLSDEEALDLIFTPGFSTADAVTDLSGRGVGMDAVRAAIGRLGGLVSVRSRPGEGTTVRFILPLTVMISRVMTVEVAGQVFGIPFDSVAETLRLPREAVVPLGAARAFTLRDRTVPLIDLAELLALDGGTAGSREPPLANLVVIDAAGRLGALEVERFGERLEVMLKPMEGLLAGMPGISGTTLLGDGRVLIVLDPGELLR